MVIRLTVLIVSITLSNMFLFGQEDAIKKSGDSSYYEKSSNLKEYYVMSHSTNSDTSDYYINKFVNEFPSDFSCFVNIYGYDFETEKLSILYYKSKEHIELFNRAQSKVRNKKAYFIKIIDICKDGKWQADGVSYFNKLVHKKVRDNQELINILMNEYTENEIYQFWRFYFDGPAPPKKIPDHLLNKFKTDDKLHNIVRDALDSVREKWSR